MLRGGSEDIFSRLFCIQFITAFLCCQVLLLMLFLCHNSRFPCYWGAKFQTVQPWRPCSQILSALQPSFLTMPSTLSGPFAQFSNYDVARSQFFADYITFLVVNCSDFTISTLLDGYQHGWPAFCPYLSKGSLEELYWQPMLALWWATITVTLQSVFSFCKSLIRFAFHGPL